MNKQEEVALAARMSALSSLVAFLLAAHLREHPDADGTLTNITRAFRQEVREIVASSPAFTDETSGAFVAAHTRSIESIENIARAFLKRMGPSDM